MCDAPARKIEPLNDSDFPKRNRRLGKRRPMRRRAGSEGTHAASPSMATSTTVCFVAEGRSRVVSSPHTLLCGVGKLLTFLRRPIEAMMSRAERLKRG